MTSTTLTTVLLSSVILTLVIGVSDINSAFADRDPVEEKLAKEAYEINEMKEMKEKEGKTSEAKKLKAQYDEKIKKLNEHGLATEEQFEADPEYWLNARADYLFPPSVEMTSLENNYADNNEFNNNFVEAHDHCGCGYKLLKYMAGYKYVWWGINWVNYSDDGWEYVAAGNLGSSEIDITEGNNVQVNGIHLARGHGAPVTISWDGYYYLKDTLGDVQSSSFHLSEYKYFSDGFVSHSRDYGQETVNNNWVIEVQAYVNYAS